jgi:hypothetical protein
MALRKDEARLQAGWARRVNQQECPVAYPDCNGDCMQFAIVPMIVNRKTIGVALIGTSLAELILAFNPPEPMSHCSRRNDEARKLLMTHHSEYSRGESPWLH